MTDLLNPNQTNTLPLNNLPPLPPLPPLPTQPNVIPQAYSGSPIANSNPPKKNIKPLIIIGIILLLLIIGCLVFNSLVGNKKNTKSNSTVTKDTTAITKTNTKSNSQKSTITATPTEEKQQVFREWRYQQDCEFNGISRAVGIAIWLKKIDNNHYFANYVESLDSKIKSNLPLIGIMDVLEKNSNGDYVGLYSKELKLTLNIIDEKSVILKNSVKSNEIIDSCLEKNNYTLKFITYSTDSNQEDKSIFKEGNYLSEDSATKLQITQKSRIGFVATITDIQSGKSCFEYLKQTSTWTQGIIDNTFDLSQESSTSNLILDGAKSSLEEHCGFQVISKVFKPIN